MTLYVERDYASLHVAARECLEEEWALSQISPLLAKTPDPEALIRKTVKKRQLAEGYYKWIGYLLWLSRMHDIASFRDLTSAEAHGIEIVRSAGKEFLANHPKCEKCGAMNVKHSFKCYECGVEFDR